MSPTGFRGPFPDPSMDTMPPKGAHMDDNIKGMGDEASEIDAINQRIDDLEARVAALEGENAGATKLGPLPTAKAHPFFGKA